MQQDHLSHTTSKEKHHQHALQATGELHLANFPIKFQPGPVKNLIRLIVD